MKVWSLPGLQSVKSLEDLRRFVTQSLTNVTQILSNGVGFQDNINCQIVDVRLGLSETAISHSLGVIPIGYIVLKAYSTAGSYPVVGSTAWTTEKIYLQTDSSNIDFTIAIIGS